MSILYYDNCWFTNVGEAFIDIGAKVILNKIFPNERIINISRMSRYYINETLSHKFDTTSNVSEVRYLKMWDYVGNDAKYLVLSGMFACDEMIDSLDSNQDFIRDLKRRHIPIIFLGLGQARYSSEETDRFKKFLYEIQPSLIVARDKTVYNNFKGDFNIIDGIDSAFWCKDDYDPSLTVARRKYDIVAYNRSAEPEKLNCENEIVRAYHFQYKFRKKHITDNMLISDSPYDYLSMYACCDKVYTDLVHATIISLQYGKHVRFDRVDNRGLAIDALDDLVTDSNGMIYINCNDLEIQKQRIISQIKKYINS